jgi:hypothetical protein
MECRQPKKRRANRRFNMEKKFYSFQDLGYDSTFYNSEGVRHLDNRFIGVYGSPDDGWTLAYCDSVTGEIYEQDIFEDVDGEKILVDIETVVLENAELLS